MSSFFSSPPSLLPITLNVYNASHPSHNIFVRALAALSNNVGLGVHHTNVDVGVYRYQFDGVNGVTRRRLRDDVGSDAVAESEMEGFVYSRSFVLGDTELGQGEVEVVLGRLGEFFPPGSYDVVGRNCNHFTYAFASALLLTRGEVVGNDFGRVDRVYPKAVNRLARAGKNLGRKYDGEGTNDGEGGGRVRVEVGKALGVDVGSPGEEEEACQRREQKRSKKVLTGEQLAHLEKLKKTKMTKTMKTTTTAAAKTTKK